MLRNPTIQIGWALLSKRDGLHQIFQSRKLAEQAAYALGLAPGEFWIEFGDIEKSSGNFVSRELQKMR